METTETTTLATTTDAAPAAPATSAPASTTTTSERPTDARSLATWMEQRAAATATTPASTPAQTGTPAARVPGAATDAAATTHPAAKEGPIPFDVHKTALDNARTKAVAEYRQKYGWAEQVPQAALTKWTETAQKMTRDPWGHVREFVSELMTHPEYGKTGRTEIARIMSGFRSAQPAPDFTPDVQVVDDQGRVSGATFSAEKVKQLVTYSVQRAVADAIGREVAPLKHEHATRQAQARADATSKALEAKADDAMAEIGELLEITDDVPPARRQELYAAMNALMDQDEKLSPHKAAMAVRKSHIVPAQQGKATQDAVDRMKQKAAGNTANGAGTAATPGKLRTREDLARFLASRAR